MESTGLVDQFGAGAEHEVIGVCEHDLSAKSFDLGGMQRLDGRLRAHRHENGSLYRAATRVNSATTRSGQRIGSEKLEGERSLSVRRCVTGRRVRGSFAGDQRSRSLRGMLIER